MKSLKWILVALAGIVVMLLAGVLVVTQWVDPNVFKPRVVAALSAATGRPVRLAGDLEFAWFPWIALRAGEGTLGNPPSFEGAPLLRWREARLGARLWPLLHGELVLDRVRLDGLDLELRRDAAGRSNWDGLTLATGGGKEPGARPLTLAGLDLRGARIGFVDEADGTSLRLEGLDLTTGAWTAGQVAPVEIEAGFALYFGARRVLEQAKLKTSVAVPGTATGGSTGTAQATPGPGPEPTAGVVLALGPTILSTRLLAAGLAPAGVPVRLELPSARLDLGRSAYRLPSMRVAIGAARLALSELAYDRPGAAPAKAGASFALAPTSLRALLVALGIAAPVTTDPRALEVFGADGRIALADGLLTIEPLTIVLDDTRLTGRMQRGGEPPLAEFSLAGTTMNVDRYLEPDDVESKPFKFPGEALAALRARGTLTLETATFDDLAFEGLVVRLLLDEQGLRGDRAALREAAR